MEILEGATNQLRAAARCRNWVNRVGLTVGLATSDLPPEADIGKAGRHVSKVLPEAD